MSNYFEKVVKKVTCDVKFVANWMITELLALSNKHSILPANIPVSPSDFSCLINAISDKRISSKQAKTILEKMWKSGKSPDEIIDEEGFSQISDEGQINKLVDNVLKNHYKSVEEYKNGKDKLFGFFVGEIIKESKGKANPQIVTQILKEKLKDDN